MALGGGTVIGRGVIGVTLDRQGFETDLNGMEQSSKSRFSKIGKIAAAGLAIGIGAGVLALKSMTQAAIEDEASQARLARSLKNTTGATDSQVKSVESWITAQGKAFGVTDDELRPALTKLATATGDVGKAQKLTSLAMDISAGTGKSLEAVTTALARAQNGNVSSLSRLGIQVKDSTKDSIAFRKAEMDLAKAQTDYNEAVKEYGPNSVQAREAAMDLEYRQMKLGEANQKTKETTVSFSEAIDRLGKAYGGQAAEKADTLQGKIARLRIIFDETKEAIGARLIPILSNLGDWFLDEGIPALSRFGAYAQENIVPPLRTIGGVLMDTVVPAMLGLGRAIVSVGGFLVEHKNLTLGLASALGVLGVALKVNAAIMAVTAAGGLAAFIKGIPIIAAATKVWAGVQWLLNAALAASGIGLVVIALGALVTGLIIAYKKSDTFREIVNAAFGAVKKVVLGVIEWFGNNVVPFFTKTLPNAFKATKEWVEQKWQAIQDAITGPVKAAKTAIGNLWGDIQQRFTTAKEWVQNTWSAAWDKVEGTVKAPISAAKTAVLGWWGDIQERFRAVREWAVQTWSSTWDKVEDIIIAPVRKAKEVIQGFFGEDGPVRNAFKNVVEAIGRIWDGLKEAAAAPVRFVVNTVYNNGIRKVVNAIPGIPGELGEIHMASGGVLPGYTPGRDVHRFFSPTAGILDLSGGEGILRPEAVRMLGGTRGIQGINDMARRRIGAFFLGGVMPTRASSVSRHSGYPWARWAGDLNDPGSGDYGDPVVAWKSGVIAATNYWTTSYGQHIRMNHSGQSSLYAHLSQVGARVGQSITAGQQIGRVGSTGNSSGPHLHFEVMGGNVDLGDGGPGGGGGGPSLGEQFREVLGTIKDFIGKIGGWYSDLTAMGGWGGMMRQMIGGVVDGVKGWIKDKLGFLGNLLPFDTGGVLRNGAVGVNRSGAPERVLSPRQTETFDRLVTSIVGGSPVPFTAGSIEAEANKQSATETESLADGLASLADQLDELRRDIKRLPRDYRFGERQGAGAR